LIGFSRHWETKFILDFVEGVRSYEKDLLKWSEGLKKTVKRLLLLWQLCKAPD
jgi:hypothetical protein